MNREFEYEKIKFGEITSRKDSNFICCGDSKKIIVERKDKHEYRTSKRIIRRNCTKR